MGRISAFAWSKVLRFQQNTGGDCQGHRAQDRKKPWHFAATYQSTHFLPECTYTYNG